MKWYYIANARMPTEKAHGIQIAKMCEAFIEAGVDIELWVPARKTVQGTVQDFYRLRTPVPMRRFWVPDFYLYGAVGYRFSSYFFMAQYTAALLWKKFMGEKFVLYTVDMDAFSSSLLPLVGVPVYTEMHAAKRNTFLLRRLFYGAAGVVAINSAIVEELQKTFPYSRAKFIVEPNGVDEKNFYPMNSNESRQSLGLQQGASIALYSGRFFDWKGLEILPKAAELTPNVEWYLVGGDERHFREFVSGEFPPNIHFVKDRPYAEMPLWQAAADALVVLGTKRDTASYRYTSPMKLFEYLLSGRPIVASETPAIASIVSNKEVLMYKPDNAADLAQKVLHVIENAEEARALIAAATLKGKQYSWKARAERIKKFITRDANSGTI